MLHVSNERETTIAKYETAEETYNFRLPINSNFLV